MGPPRRIAFRWKARGIRPVGPGIGVWLAGCVATGALAAPWADGSSPDPIVAPEATAHVVALADDALEGREGGTRGGRAAGAYLADFLGREGLEPAGDAGGFFQPFGPMRNVLAIVPGSDPAVAHELVVVGAHYDHVGYGTAENSNGPTGLIHNGADDNASGVAGVLEIAASLRSMPTPPRRPVLVALWDGEEKGLLGSRHFLRQPPAGLRGRKPAFSLNLDMIGRLRSGTVEVYGVRSGAGLRRLLVAANRGEDLGLVFDWDVVDDSDHFPFIEAGVPSLMLHTGLHPEYHRPGDDAHLIDGAGLASVGRLAEALVVAVADLDGPLPSFRGACRGEGNALRDALEAPVVGGDAGGRGRWGMSTRADGADPAAPIVVRVVPGSPLHAAGLQVNDRVLALDGVAVVDHGDMVERLGRARRPVTLLVERRGRCVEIRAGAPAPATR